MPLRKREWFPRGPVPASDSQPERLREECERLNKEIAAVIELRAVADKIDARLTLQYAKDPNGTDRRPFFSAAAAALQAELRILERIETASAADQEIRRCAHREAENGLNTAVAAVRKRLAIPPEIVDVPVACLQNDAGWWLARSNLAKSPEVGRVYSGEITATSEAIEEWIDECRRLIDQEELRLRTTMSQVIEEDAVVERNRAEMESRQAERNEKRSKVNSLLGVG